MNNYVISVLVLLIIAGIMLSSCERLSTQSLGENGNPLRENTEQRDNLRPEERDYEIPIDLEQIDMGDYISWDWYPCFGYNVYELIGQEEVFLVRLAGANSHRYTPGQETVNRNNRLNSETHPLPLEEYIIRPYMTYGAEDFIIPVLTESVDKEVSQKYYENNGLTYISPNSIRRLTFYNTIEGDSLSSFSIDTDETGKVSVHIEELITHGIFGLGAFFLEIQGQSMDRTIDSLIVSSIDASGEEISHKTVYRNINFPIEDFDRRVSLKYPLKVLVNEYLQTIADNNPLWPTPIIGGSTDTQSLIPTEGELISFLAEATGGSNVGDLAEIINLKMTIRLFP